MLDIKIKKGASLKRISKAVMTISVGQPYHEGEMFAAEASFVNQNFKSCILDLGDSLQRYSFTIYKGFSLEEAYQASKEEGNLWLERNKDYLSKINIPMEKISWDTWINHPDYERTKESFDHIYKDNSFYKKIVDDNAFDFLMRRKKAGYNPKNWDVAQKLSVQYLLEEVAGQTLFAREKGPFVSIYPGEDIPVLKTVRHSLIPEAPKGLEKEHCMRIGFKIQASELLQKTYYKKAA